MKEFLAGSALTLAGGENPTPSDYAKLLGKIKGSVPTSTCCRRAAALAQQAVYSPENEGHFGLRYDAYTHFTSPIRRYPDLLIHRCIKSCSHRRTLSTVRLGRGPSSGVHCSQTERRADDATRDVENWLKCYFMQDNVGEVYAGTVSGVNAFGLFVTLDGL